MNWLSFIVLLLPSLILITTFIINRINAVRFNNNCLLFSELSEFLLGTEYHEDIKVRFSHSISTKFDNNIKSNDEFNITDDMYHATYENFQKEMLNKARLYQFKDSGFYIFVRLNKPIVKIVGNFGNTCVNQILKYNGNILNKTKLIKFIDDIKLLATKPIENYVMLHDYLVEYNLNKCDK